MSSSPVKFAVLHEPIAVPTADGKMVNLKNTLDPLSVEGKRWALTMETGDGGLNITVNGTTALVPLTNFKVIVLDKVAPAAKGK